MPPQPIEYQVSAFQTRKGDMNQSLRSIYLSIRSRPHATSALIGFISDLKSDMKSGGRCNSGHIGGGDDPLEKTHPRFNRECVECSITVVGVLFNHLRRPVGESPSVFQMRVACPRSAVEICRAFSLGILSAFETREQIQRVDVTPVLSARISNHWYPFRISNANGRPPFRGVATC